METVIRNTNNNILTIIVKPAIGKRCYINGKKLIGKTMKVYETTVDGEITIHGVEDIKHFTIIGDSDFDISEISKFKRLTKLSLSDNSAHGNISHLAECVRLRYLMLQNNIDVHGDVNVFKNHTYLRTIDLSRTSVSGSLDTLIKLPLIRLSVYNTNINATDTDTLTIQRG